MDEAIERLRQWTNGIKISHIAHARSAAFYQSRGRLLGISVVVLTSIAGTTIIGDLAGERGSNTARVIAGVLSLGATVLAALQTFLNYPEMAAKHREAEVRYGALRRDVEMLLSFVPTSEDALRDAMSSVRKTWTEYENSSPAVPQSIYDHARQMAIGGVHPNGSNPRS